MMAFHEHHRQQQIRHTMSVSIISSSVSPFHRKPIVFRSSTVAILGRFFEVLFSVYNCTLEGYRNKLAIIDNRYRRNLAQWRGWQCITVAILGRFFEVLFSVYKRTLEGYRNKLAIIDNRYRRNLAQWRGWQCITVAILG